MLHRRQIEEQTHRRSETQLGTETDEESFSGVVDAVGRGGRGWRVGGADCTGAQHVGVSSPSWGPLTGKDRL